MGKRQTTRVFDKEINEHLGSFFKAIDFSNKSASEIISLSLTCLLSYLATKKSRLPPSFTVPQVATISLTRVEMSQVIPLLVKTGLDLDEILRSFSIVKESDPLNEVADLL